MPQITNLGVLFSKSAHHPNPIFKFKNKIPTKPHRYHSKLFTSNCSSDSSSLKQSGNKESSLMKIGGFNKKRAEGKDQSRPKDLKLKVRRLNPVNTLSYVQILETGMDTQDTSPSVLLFFDKQRFIFNAGELKYANGLWHSSMEIKENCSKIPFAQPLQKAPE
ncbi:hypothetical protein L1987_47632 [Smallanthus sonchifolius]|uniref:Uncharacterized protein n=1 Tax=Smallanthus sonchifolius TaxID=185202 RepID=A0ACB9G338_9ASTR|nr:hypothetical protein L1987_47632 [Smallanthus sonchifolius]